ncbi:MAG: serine hydrolase [Spirochaetales bacterium]|nr:serine hydrolase [Spirochaetales bacterium]
MLSSCALRDGIFLPASQIERAVDRALRGRVKQYSLSLYDPVSGERLRVRASRVYPAASTMKAAILFSAFSLSDRRLLSLEKRITVENQFTSVADGSIFQVPPELSRKCTCLAWRNQGADLTIRLLLRDMIRNSSNLATNLLIKEMGAAAIMQELKRAGIEGVSISRGLYDLPAFDRNWHNTLTADGTLELFYQIYYSSFFSMESRLEMVEILSRTIHRDRLPALLPGSASVAHKAGMTDDVAHDAGIVFPAGQNPYFVAILTEGYESRPAASAALAEASLLLYEHIRDQRNRMAVGYGGK